MNEEFKNQLATKMAATTTGGDFNGSKKSLETSFLNTISNASLNKD